MLFRLQPFPKQATRDKSLETRELQRLLRLTHVVHQILENETNRLDPASFWDTSGTMVW